MSVYSEQSKNLRYTWILIFVFIGLVSALFFGLGYIYNNSLLGFIGLAVSLGQATFAYFAGDKVALAMAGGKEVTYDESPQIHETVQNLCRVADIPKPKIFISPDKSANAFACGRDPKNASICLNQGLLDILDKNELEGVIAHELSHIRNRDILVMTVVSVMAGVISFISDIGLRMAWFGGKKDNENRSPLVIIIYLVLLVIAPIASMLISMAISRRREYLADATAVTLTRYPEGLARALDKLYKSPVPTSHYSTATNHFYIAPPKRSWGQKFSGLFNTHPPIQERIEKLRQM